jgi:hypothetical protein
VSERAVPERAALRRAAHPRASRAVVQKRFEKEGRGPGRLAEVAERGARGSG